MKKKPREFYYALMDYGSILKRRAGNPNARSASYSRQSPFEGSDRQVRGIILRHLLAGGGAREEELRGLCTRRARTAGADPQGLGKGWVHRTVRGQDSMLAARPGGSRMTPCSPTGILRKGAEEGRIGEKGSFYRLFHSRTMETGDTGRDG